MRAFAAIVTVALLANSPASLVSDFHAQYLRYPHTGLLSAQELERIRPYLSDRLHGLFANAIRYQQDWMRRNPSPLLKPPLVEGGEWFESLAEWPDVRSLTGDEPRESFEVVDTVHRAKNVWHVQVRFAYATEPRVTWVDTFVVNRERGRYVIDDVIYSGAPFYYRDGRLSELLRDAR
ncbi:MAG TPA: hypothetical protein VJZ00_12965 [Thermoanaerobaculia bacterium]|nr:hypothetical protein [Thermoanaerobaculia bacterium]